MPDKFNFPQYHFILASKSPRRQYLLKELGLDVDIQTRDVDESFPDNLKAQEIPLYLCEKKANAFDGSLKDNSIVITADTIVWINNGVLNKPIDHNDAVRMLKLLSGNTHEVFTAVCLKSKRKTLRFYSASKVYFKNLSDKEIDQYINNYKPFDKAGAYGAQECLRAGVPPCSQEETDFLLKMGKPELNKIDSAKSTETDIGTYFVERIEGSYFNVMGLPVMELYKELIGF
jgi:septum formation protein